MKNNPETRTFIVGDIHGCFAELAALLTKAGVRDTDLLVSVGDFVDRGPEPVAVYDFLRQRSNTICLLGNHEDKLIRGRSEGLKQALSQQITRAKFGDRFEEFLDWAEGLALYHRLPELNTIVVHAGYLGDVTDRRMLLRGMRPHDNPFKTKFCWEDHYDGDETVICGHALVPEIDPQSDIIHLDTGCIHGYELTGIWLPERRLVSVPALTDYWGREKKWWKQRSVESSSGSDEDVAETNWWVQCSPAELRQLLSTAAEQDGSTTPRTKQLLTALQDANAVVAEAADLIRREAERLAASFANTFGTHPHELPRSDVSMLVHFAKTHTNVPAFLVLAVLRDDPAKLKHKLGRVPLAELKTMLNTQT